MEFRFSAGELFLLVDEKKIKRRFILSIHDFHWERGQVHSELCVGYIGMANVRPTLLSREPVSSPNLSVVRISLRHRYS